MVDDLAFRGESHQGIAAVAGRSGVDDEGVRQHVAVGALVDVAAKAEDRLVSLDCLAYGWAAHLFAAGQTVGSCAEGRLVRDEHKGLGGFGEGDAPFEGDCLLGLGQGERREVGAWARPGQSAKAHAQNPAAGGVQSDPALLEQVVGREMVAVSADGQQMRCRSLGEIQKGLGLAFAAEMGQVAAEDHEVAANEIRGRMPQQRRIAVQV